MYRIERDDPRRLMRLELRGFWTVDEARAFARDQQAAVLAMGPPFGSHLTLADVSGFALQTQEVSAVIRELVVHAANVSARIALVGSHGLARLQFRRITEREGTRLFDTADEAERWLYA